MTRPIRTWPSANSVRLGVRRRPVAGVALKEGSSEHKDPGEFYRRTYITEGLWHLLVAALKRLGGGEPGSRGAGDRASDKLRGRQDSGVEISPDFGLRAQLVIDIGTVRIRRPGVELGAGLGAHHPLPACCVPAPADYGTVTPGGREA